MTEVTRVEDYEQTADEIRANIARLNEKVRLGSCPPALRDAYVRAANARIDFRA